MGLGFPNGDFKVRITHPCPAKASSSFMLGFGKYNSRCKTELFSLCTSASEAFPMTLIILEEGKVPYSSCFSPRHAVV